MELKEYYGWPEYLTMVLAFIGLIAVCYSLFKKQPPKTEI